MGHEACPVSAGGGTRRVQFLQPTRFLSKKTGGCIRAVDTRCACSWHDALVRGTPCPCPRHAMHSPSWTHAVVSWTRETVSWTHTIAPGTHATSSLTSAGGPHGRSRATSRLCGARRSKFDLTHSRPSRMVIEGIASRLFLRRLSRTRVSKSGCHKQSTGAKSAYASPPAARRSASRRTRARTSQRHPRRARPRPSSRWCRPAESDICWWRSTPRRSRRSHRRS